MRSTSVFCCSVVYGAALLAGVAAAQVAAPVFVPFDADGVTPFKVTVTSATPGAVIRYTLNGADPVSTDLPLPGDGKITVNRGITLKAKAWFGSDSSTVTTSTYSVMGAISAGDIHSLALKGTQSLLAWGNQGNGRLGNGVTSGNQSSPVSSRYSSSVTVADAVGLAAGKDHSHFIKLNSSTGERTVWSFGNNGAGELGNNSTGGESYAVQVVKSTTTGDYLTGINEVAAGTNFSIAVHSDGSVYSWGTKTNGRLGEGGTSGTRKYAGKVQKNETGTPNLSGILSVRACNGAAFAREACAKEIPGSAGQVWVWGLNTSGQLGIDSTSSQSRAVRMKDSTGVPMTDVWDVSAGDLHTAVVRWRDGAQPINRKVWCVGQQEYGRLGNGSTTANEVDVAPATPVQTTGNVDLEGITAVAAGAAHTLALDSLGNVWSWGDNSTGALGDPNVTTNRAKAGKVRLPAAPPVGTPDELGNIIAVSAGGTGTNGYSLALAADGTVYGWGSNGNGQQGNGGSSTVTRPKIINSFKLLAGYPEVGLTSTRSPVGAPGTVLLTATPTDPDGATGLKVKFYVNGEMKLEKTSAPWTYSYTPTQAGSYHAFAIVSDPTQIEAQSPPVNFSLAAPEVSLAAAFGGNSEVLTATPTDADGADDLASVKFYVAGIAQPVGTATAPPWICYWIPPGVGSYQATAVVSDKFGLESTSAPAPFSIHAPQTSLAVTAIVHEKPGFAALTASPTDANGNWDVTKVEFFDPNDVLMGTATGFPWTFEMSGLDIGSYTVKAKAYDYLNLQGVSQPITFTISAPGSVPDDDGDGLTNAQETAAGTSSTDTDSDNDGIPDGEDANPLTPDILTLTTSGLSVWAPLP